MKRLLPLLLVTCTLSACMNTQSSSGTMYQQRYRNVPLGTAAGAPNAATGDKGSPSYQLNREIRESAAVEPVLRFPARIGIIRLKNSMMTNIPESEAGYWQAAQQKLGGGYGEFVPISPMVVRTAAIDGYSYSNNDQLMSQIRLGAARQHLDAVLVYEVFGQETKQGSMMEVLDLTIVGGFIFPSHTRTSQAYSTGMLIDVVQGYPYGTIQGKAERDERLSSSWGWGVDRAQENLQRIEARSVKNLSEEAVTMFTRLRGELAQKEGAR